MSDRQLLDSLVAALGSLGQGVAVVDLSTRRYLSVNGALADILGYSEQELLAMPSFFSTLPATDAAALEPQLERTLAGRDLARELYGARIVRKDGGEREVEVSAQALDGLVDGGLIALVRDVTGQLRRERDLAAAELRYRTLVERLPVVTYVAEPGEAGRWVYVSPQIETMFGYPAQDWLGDPTLWARLVHRDDRERVFAAEDRLEQGERLPLIEYRMFSRRSRRSAASRPFRPGLSRGRSGTGGGARNRTLRRAAAKLLALAST